MNDRAFFIALIAGAFFVSAFSWILASFSGALNKTKTLLFVLALWAVCCVAFRAIAATASPQSSTWTSYVGVRALPLAGVLAVTLAVGACSGPPPPTPSETAVRVGEDVYITAYTWFDNTPPGSPTISHPVLHKTAGGSGTYEDPVTIAAGHSRETGESVLDYPAGTRIYLPDVRRYFIVEDTCGDGEAPEDGPCHTGAEEFGDASIWLDMWIGGEEEGADFALRCARQVTGVRTAVFDPADNYLVATGNGVIHDGECDSGYGNELLTK